MQTLHKRIENLEKAAVPMLRARRRIAEKALDDVSDLESLISAFGAEREGRSLTESESASRQAYGSGFEREFRQTLLRLPTQLERAPDAHVIDYAIITALSRRFELEELQLASSGMLAEQQGRVPTEAELEAIQQVNSGTPLYQLAGFRSRTEFEIF